MAIRHHIILNNDFKVHNTAFQYFEAPQYIILSPLWINQTDLIWFSNLSFYPLNQKYLDHILIIFH